MSFVQIKPKKSQYHLDGEVVVRSDGYLWIAREFNAFFTGFSNVAIYMDEQAQEMGLRPAEPHEENAFAIAKSGVSIKSIIKTFKLTGVNTRTIYKAKWDAEKLMLIVDLKDKKVLAMYRGDNP